MTLRPILLAFAPALSLAAFADDAQPVRSPDAQEQATLQSFAAAHPECEEWSDGCAVCKRATAVSCSTPGIACQPREIACQTP